MTTAPPTDNDIRRLIISYTVACTALLAVLVLVIAYGLFINKAALVAGDEPETGTPTKEVAAGGWVAPPSSSAVDAGVDGDLTFTVQGFEVDGSRVVVHLTVANVGNAPATFLGARQTLKADGAVYYLDDEATAALGGDRVELAPGAKTDVAMAFAVPEGAVPDAVELHADSASPGVELSLS